MDEDELEDKLLELRREMDYSDLNYAAEWFLDEIDESARRFMDKVNGKKIIDVNILKGSEDMSASECQFEFELEGGYSFVG